MLSFGIREAAGSQPATGPRRTGRSPPLEASSGASGRQTHAPSSGSRRHPCTGACAGRTTSVSHSVVPGFHPASTVATPEATGRQRAAEARQPSAVRWSASHSWAPRFRSGCNHRPALPVPCHSVPGHPVPVVPPGGAHVQRDATPQPGPVTRAGHLVRTSDIVPRGHGGRPRPGVVSDEIQPRRHLRDACDDGHRDRPPDPVPVRRGVCGIPAAARASSRRSTRAPASRTPRESPGSELRPSRSQPSITHRESARGRAPWRAGPEPSTYSASVSRTARMLGCAASTSSPSGSSASTSRPPPCRPGPRDRVVPRPGPCEVEAGEGLHELTNGDRWTRLGAGPPTGDGEEAAGRAPRPGSRSCRSQDASPVARGLRIIPRSRPRRRPRGPATRSCPCDVVGRSTPGGRCDRDLRPVHAPATVQTPVPSSSASWELSPGLGGFGPLDTRFPSRGAWRGSRFPDESVREGSRFPHESAGAQRPGARRRPDRSR